MVCKSIPGDKPVSKIISEGLNKQFLAAVARMSAANVASNMKDFIPAAEDALRLLQKMNHLENGGPDPDELSVKPPLVKVEIFWGVYNPDDNLSSMYWPSEEEAISDELFNQRPNITWKDLYGKGYRCHQVEVRRVCMEDL